MFTFYQKTLSSKRLREISEYKAGSWIYVESPTEGEIQKLAEIDGLDGNILQDSLDPYEVPRVEVDGKTVYIFTRFPYLEEGRVLTLPVLLGLSEGFVFTVAQRKLPFLDKFVEGKIEFNTTQKIRFLLQMLQEIDSVYNNMIVLISKDIRRLQGSLEGEITNKDIVSFVHFENVLSDLLDSLSPTHSTLQSLLSGKFLKLYEADREFTEDLVLETGQLIERTRSLLRTVVNIRNAYSTIMTNTLNRVIKFLTGMTIVLTVPAIMVNLFGMNMRLPFDTSSEYAFIGAVSLMTLATALIYFYFKRQEWI